VPDVDAVYNPLAFYGTRATVVGITELYAAVDRAVVRSVAFATDVAADPTDAVASTSVGDRMLSDEYAHPLRAGIGTSILLVTLIATLTPAYSLRTRPTSRKSIRFRTGRSAVLRPDIECRSEVRSTYFRNESITKCAFGVASPVTGLRPRGPVADEGR
jgi:hypothetical protein